MANNFYIGFIGILSNFRLFVDLFERNIFVIKCFIINHGCCKKQKLEKHSFMGNNSYKESPITTIMTYI